MEVAPCATPQFYTLHFTFYILNSIRFNPAGFAPPTDTNLVFTKHEKIRCSIGFRLTVQEQNGLVGLCHARSCFGYWRH